MTYVFMKMKSLFAKRVKSTKCNFEKIDILYHDYLIIASNLFSFCVMKAGTY